MPYLDFAIVLVAYTRDLCFDFGLFSPPPLSVIFQTRTIWRKLCQSLLQGVVFQFDRTVNILDPLTQLWLALQIHGQHQYPDLVNIPWVRMLKRLCILIEYTTNRLWCLAGFCSSWFGLGLFFWRLRTWLDWCALSSLCFLVSLVHGFFSSWFWLGLGCLAALLWRYWWRLH